MSETQPTPTPATERTDRLVSALLLGVGIYSLALAILQVVAPGTFFREIGPFGEQNDHYIRDTATFQAALGVLAIAGARLRSWRLPALVILALQFGLHTVNHLVDIGEADPEWLGPADFAGLAIATALLVAALASVRGRDGGAAR